MPSQAAKFVSALFAGVLAGIPLATISHGAMPGADDCLSGPKDQAPQGGHWYYRIDHATKRHCWYLKDEKPSQSAAANSAPSAKPVSPNAEAATQRSIADAHAELPAQFAIERSNRGNGFAPAIAADAPIVTPAAETQRSVVASRWPEQSETTSSAVPASTATGSGVAAPPDSDETPSAAHAEVTLAAADSSSENQSGSIRTLLLVILGALALAGLIGNTIFKFGNARWTGRRQVRVDRRAIWNSTGVDRLSPPVDLGAGTRVGRNQMPWELRTADDPNGKVEALLARLARSAAR
jgi:hypothetical protein